MQKDIRRLNFITKFLVLFVFVGNLRVKNMKREYNKDLSSDLLICTTSVKLHCLLLEKYYDCFIVFMYAISLRLINIPHFSTALYNIIEPDSFWDEDRRI